MTSCINVYISGNKEKEAPSEDDPNEMTDLYEEATMSLEDLITRYGKRLRDGATDELKEGRSANPALDFVVSKLYAKGNSVRKAAAEESKAEGVADEAPSTVKGEKTDKEAAKVPTDSDNSAATEPAMDVDKPTLPESDEGANNKTSPEANGKHQNGSNNHDSEDSNKRVVVVSSKGKGVGKGLSNNIRKTVEKTPEELERERREAERTAKRLERKESLRNKSADELYKFESFFVLLINIS